jgi:hypothetical protein
MYVALGLTKQEVMDACPVEVEYVFEAQKIRKRMSDQANWELGMYVESAVAVAVERNLAGNKARGEYVKEPFIRKLEREEEQRRGASANEQLVARLLTWQKNWEMEHKNTEE